MKGLTNFLQRKAVAIKNRVSKNCLMYAGIFFGIMVGLYLYMILAGMAKAPNFTYAEF